MLFRSRWLSGGSRAPPESANGSGDLSCSFFLASGAALGALLGRSWPLLALSWRLLGRAWLSRGAPGSHFRHPGASFGTRLGLFFRRLWKNTKTLIFDDTCSENQGLGVPGGSKIEPKWLPNRSWRLLALSWRLSALSWRLLAASWRLLGPLGRLLGRSWGDFKLQHETWLSWNGKRVRSESCKHCKR